MSPRISTPALLVLAAGLGSRYGGLKQMDSVGLSGETVLDYSVYGKVKRLDLCGAPSPHSASRTGEYPGRVRATPCVGS